MVAPSTSLPASYRFGSVQLLTVERRLLIDGRDVTVGARAFDVLLTLIERRERLVPHNELLDLVWPDVAVEPNNVAVQIGALRKVIGPQVIATIPGRGYRFSAVVDEPARAVPQVHLVASTPRQRTNLPEQPPVLVGRVDELRIVGSLIDAHRVVTITGAGGIGKTRLAQRLLHERRDQYRHGVCWIELASIDDASTLPSAIAAALGIKLAAGEPRALLEAALKPLDILICLDNAEHLADETGRLVEALAGASTGVRFIVTSQAQLRISDEQVVRLDPLAVPPASASADEALRYGAIDLFVQRALAADYRYKFDEAKVSGVIRLCGRLDGLPLAIEFAAARAPLLGVESILKSLDRRLEVLKGGHRSAPARQQTMLATLEWSHHLLVDEERVVFRRLAVIAGSASLELIQAITADVDDATDFADDDQRLDRWAVIDALGGLVDRSLVAILLNDHDPDRPRYRLLETPRAYAIERLCAAAEVARLEERHARAVAALFDAAWTERWSGRIGWDDWIVKYEADLDNGRAAFTWAVRTEHFDLVLAMAPVLLIRGFLTRAGINHQIAIAETVDQWLSSRPIKPGQLPTRMQLVRFWDERDVPRVRVLDEAERALRLAESCDDRFAIYAIESSRVRTLVQMRELSAAAASLARVDALEDPAWPPVRLWLGAEARYFYALVNGSPRATLNAAGNVQRIVRLAGNDGFVSAGNLIDAELGAGEAVSAAEHGLALLAQLSDARNVFGLMGARINTAAALLAVGDVLQAAPVAKAAWEMAPYFGAKGCCADYLALICALENRWASAAVMIGYADTAYSRRGAQRWPVEVAAHDRTVQLVSNAMGVNEFESLVDEGARLSDAEIDNIVFPAR